MIVVGAVAVGMAVVMVVLRMVERSMAMGMRMALASQFILLQAGHGDGHMGA